MSNRGIQLIEEEVDVERLELQHVNMKLLLKNPSSVDLHAAIPIFHNWIQDQVAEELLLDVATYTHVKDGPGVLLIGHEGDYSLDLTDGRLGFRYNRKAPIIGTNQDRLIQAAWAALTALDRLEQDETLHRAITFDGENFEIFLNDRLLAPNTQATRDAAGPELRAFLHRLLGGADYSLNYETEPRRLFGARIRSQRQFTTRELLNNLVRNSQSQTPSLRI